MKNFNIKIYKINYNFIFLIDNNKFEFYQLTTTRLIIIIYFTMTIPELTKQLHSFFLIVNKNIIKNKFY